MKTGCALGLGMFPYILDSPLIFLQWRAVLLALVEVLVFYNY